MHAPPLDRPIEILLAEDSPGDARLTKVAFGEASVSNHLSVVPDGEEALSFLRRQSPYADAPQPDLILLDLNMPRRDGREVLAVIKADESLCHIPVLVLTTSSAPQDVEQAYKLHANGFLTKPVDFDAFFDLVRSIEHFWMKTARLPTAG